MVQVPAKQKTIKSLSPTHKLHLPTILFVGKFFADPTPILTHVTNTAAYQAFSQLTTHSNFGL